MKQRRLSELIPLLIAFFSGVVFFNWKSTGIDVNNSQANFVLWGVTAFIFFILSISYGSIHVKKYGRNTVIWLGVTISSLLALIQFSIMCVAAIWHNIF